MRYRIGAEQLQQVPSLVHRPNTVFRVARTAPVGLTHAVCASTGVVVCGINAKCVEVLNEDWEGLAGFRAGLPVTRLASTFPCRGSVESSGSVRSEPKARGSPAW
jgi:hypothetical protein